MFVTAAAHQHTGQIIYGAALIAIGLLHLCFRRFYANRAAAVQQARRETAPAMTRGLYGNRGPGFYLALNSAISALFVVVGVVLIVVHA